MAWVCFSCRIAVRRRFTRKPVVPCPECGSACVDVGIKIPVPPKAKRKEWQALEQQIYQWQREDERVAFCDMVRRKHWLEREIRRLESRPTNDGRSQAVNILRRELAGLRPRRRARR